MTVVNNVFPQSGDADFAENFATWVGRGNITDFVETGMQITPDYVANEIDISQGKAFVVIDEKTISSNNETRLVLDYAVTIPSETGIPIDNNSTNYVYLNGNVGTNDDPTFETQTATSSDDDWLLIGIVDTSANTVEERNRQPDADFSVLSARDTFEAPAYSSTSDAESTESSVVYIDGTGSQKQGLYVHDGSGYVTAGVREINNLDDVLGVKSIESNSSASRPAAGTEGRIFIDESNDLIQRDDGSSWVDIGTNPSNIGAGDLSFDTATQSELDTHSGTTDIHHTRPTAGNGIKDQSSTFKIEPLDFAGQFLSDDSDNLDVQIGFGLEDDGSGQIQLNEDSAFTFTSQQIINNTLTMGGNINLQNNNLIEPNQIETSGSGSDSIIVQDTNSTSTIVSFNEGGEVSVESGDLTDGTNVIFDQNSSYVPLSILEQDSLTVSSGDGLKSGGSVTLGSSITLDVDVSDFAGTFLSDDGDDNLQVNIGDGLEDDGSGNIRIDDDTASNFSTSLSAPSISFDNSDADGNSWTITEDGTSGNLALNSSSNGTAVDVAQNGDMRIEGEFTEGATL